MKADLLIQVVLPAALFIIMLGMGLSLKPLDFKLVIAKPKAALLGVLAQMLMLPILAYLIILSLNIEGPLAVGLMILALCPGGTTSNLYTYLAKGDVALSVTLTSVVSLIAPFSVPFILLIFMDLLLGAGEQVNLPIVKTIIQLLVITVLPICLGMLIFRFKPGFAISAEKFVKIFSVAFLLLIVAGIVAKNINHMGSYFAQMGLATLLLNVVCMLLGFTLARLAKLNLAQQKSIAIEVGFQNGTLAIVIALTLLQNTEMAIAATCYSLLMFVTGAVFTLILGRFNGAEAPELANK
ncbi:bile acid:sodium symporter [Marinomonas sp. S3726]|uniref:bile acid:sodium symporter family protein n=1 Tax=Marinomonas sp. S3726 TaxID=579484 RepID=UPI0005F9CF94|nr:bile acid:sodium symporter family protein [Marinomonas sp. S3726]KJZ15389.1 bile acid:sodium symporter [Marinomonas sp. S3726]